MKQKDIIELLGQMTLEEKIGQMIQLNETFFIENNEVVTGPQNKIKIEDQQIYQIGSILNCVGLENVKKLQDCYRKKSRLKIPLLFMADIINGYKTIFPIPLAQGCSWNPSLIKEYAKIATIEASNAGVDVVFSPMVDLVRDARWGRVMESAGGEDPYLSEIYAKSIVSSYQEDCLKSKRKMASCVKHFAAYGAVEAGREYNTVDMSERELRQYYLPAYKAAIDSGAKLIMTSFNIINGVPATINKWLLQDILRKEWGFQGVIISDYGAIEETINHGTSENRKEAAYKALQAGVDIEMMGSTYINYLPELVKEGRISEEKIDESVLRILTLKNELGLFENPYGKIDSQVEETELMYESHRKKVKDSVEETFVLLENKNTILPLATNAKVAVIGPYANSKEVSSIWSLFKAQEEGISLKQAVEDRLGIKQVTYAQGCNVLSTKEINKLRKGSGKSEIINKNEKEEEAKIREAIQIGKQAEIILLCLGEHPKQSGEGGSRANIQIPKIQRKLLNALIKLNKPIILILFSGRPLVLTSIVKKVEAMLQVWIPGVEVGEPIADVLLGNKNPSGRLVMSFPQSVGQCPIYYNHYQTGRPNISAFRYESCYQDIPTESYYPFGYGLSYSNFEYRELRLDKDQIKGECSITATITIKNNSNVDGYEVVQMYIQDIIAEVVRPVKALKGFQKVFFKAKEEKTLSFSIDKTMLTYWNKDMKQEVGEGKFKIYIGKNAKDVLEKEFEVIE